MIFSGYNFPNSTAILPHLEHPRNGPTSQFCAELAKNLQCYVTAGYPERLAVDDQVTAIVKDSDEYQDIEIQQVGANSAVLYGPDGNWIGGYQKTNLFKTDRTWAKPGNYSSLNVFFWKEGLIIQPGPGLSTFSLPLPLGTVSIAICNDLNVTPPSSWTSLEDGPYEVANHCLATKTDTLIILCAWLHSENDEMKRKAYSTLNYWAMRLRPLWARRDCDESEMDERETTVVICNRCGEEPGTYLFIST